MGILSQSAAEGELLGNCISKSLVIEVRNKVQMDPEAPRLEKVQNVLCQDPERS